MAVHECLAKHKPWWLNTAFGQYFEVPYGSPGLQGLHEAGFEMIIVGHSLGAGAAALLGLEFKAK